MIAWAVGAPAPFEWTTSSLSSSSVTEDGGGQEAFLRTAHTSYLATINQNGTTESVTYREGQSRTWLTFAGNPIASLYSSTTSSTQITNSATTQPTYQVTTSATTTQSIFYQSTQPVTYTIGDSRWTTFLTLSDTATETKFTTSFVGVPKVWDEDVFESTTGTTETTVTIAETLTANAFNTIHQDTNVVFVSHNIPVSDVTAAHSALSAFSFTSGTRITASHNLGASSLRPVQQDSPNTVSLPTQAFVSTVTAENVFLGQLIGVTASELYNAKVLPNQTVTRNILQRQIATGTTTYGYFTGGHNGPNELISTKKYFESAYTFVDLNNLSGETESSPATFSNYYTRLGSYSEQVLYPHIVYTTNSTYSDRIGNSSIFGTVVKQGGGNTTATTNAVARGGFDFFDYGDVQLYGENEDDRGLTYKPYCAIFKPYGIMAGSELVGALSITGTTLSGLSVAALSRNAMQTPERFYELNVTKETGYNRFVLSYPDQSNDTFTISGKSVTYTRTTSSGSTTVQTTASEEMVSMLPASTAFVGARHWIGGEPEESATFYQKIFPHVYVDQDGLTSFFTGGLSTILPGESQAAKYWQPIMQAKGGFPQAIDTWSAYPGGRYCLLPPNLLPP